MSAPIEKAVAGTNPARSTVFHKRRHVRIPTREQSIRQSAIIKLAWSHFGEAAPMIAFLNARHEALDAQPLTLAIESDDGFERVQRLLQDAAPNG